MKNKLPLITATEVPAAGPRFGACAEHVEVGAGELREAAPAGAAPGAPRKTREVFDEACAVLRSAICPEGAEAAPAPARFIWAVRALVQFVLLYLRTPPTTQSQGHPDNFDTHLMPAIDNVVEYADAIDDADDRIFRKVGRDELVEQRQTLQLQREICKIFGVGAESVDAGSTVTERYLDGSARFIYSRLVGEIGGDLLLQRDLQPLVELVSAPIVAGLETKKNNARSTGATPTPPAVAETGSATPTGGVQVTVHPQAPSPVPVVGAAPPPAHLATGPAPVGAPRSGSRRKG